MLNSYPRPQFERTEWTDLNGEWNFAFDDQKTGEIQKWYENFPKGGTILVPYTYETKMSTVNDQTSHETVWYNRKVISNKKNGSRTFINFEGVDYTAKVWVNAYFIGSHTGGYSGFSFDITDFLNNGENDITVEAQDSISCLQPRGKQRWKAENFGCWYVQTTGIWKSVWLEEVPQLHLDKVKITPDLDKQEVHFYIRVSGNIPDTKAVLTCSITQEGRPIRRTAAEVKEQYISLTIPLKSEEDPWKLAVWEPGSPKLYDAELTLESKAAEKDIVHTYFGMRKISIEGNKILLNNRPIYLRMVLDQGYWEDTGLTPPSEEAIIKDIDLIMTAGYNALRKHQKIEDPRFLYWCDKKGLLVWSEMAAQYLFNDDAVTEFTKEWMEIVEQNYNHPSIITWTPFNESWGIDHIYTDKQQQKFTEAIYQLTKVFDPYRPVVVNDGWEHTISDIITLHDYAEHGDEISKRYADEEAILHNKIPFNLHRYALAKGYEYNGQPVIISEYGGIAFANKDGWGYGEQVKTEKEYLERFESTTAAIKNLGYVSGFCYTQITDVQQEVNGLYTMKREPKVNIDEIKKINKK